MTYDYLDVVIVHVILFSAVDVELDGVLFHIFNNLLQAAEHLWL